MTVVAVAQGLYPRPRFLIRLWRHLALPACLAEAALEAHAMIDPTSAPQPDEVSGMEPRPVPAPAPDPGLVPHPGSAPKPKRRAGPKPRPGPKRGRRAHPSPGSSTEPDASPAIEGPTLSLTSGLLPVDVDPMAYQRAFAYRAPFIADAMFKPVFCRVGREQPLVDIVNSLLDLRDDQRVRELRHLTPNLPSEAFGGKQLFLDVRVTDGRGRRFNVEVQRWFKSDLLPRFTAYGARMLTEQLAAGDGYDTLEQTIVIVIADTRVFFHHERVYSKVLPCDLLDPERGGVTELLQWHYFELPKMAKGDHVGLSAAAKDWLYLLHYGHHHGAGGEPLPPHLAHQKVMQMAVRYYDEASADPNIRLLAFKERLLQLSEENAAREAQKALEEAKKQGLEQGLQQGARATALANARKLRDRGMSAALIEECTGITLSELEREGGSASQPDV